MCRARFAGWTQLVIPLVLMSMLAGGMQAQAKPEGEVVYALHFTLSPTHFDPAETTGIITPFLILYALHDALAKPMPDNPMAPSLAESWTRSEDGLVYEFKLRKGVHFHNGDPFSAEDVKFSFERFKGAGSKELHAQVQAVEIVDPHLVRFRLKEPWPDFMVQYGTPATGAAWIVPKKYLERVGDDGFKAHPIGLGPYKFVSMQPGIGVFLEANEAYWRKVPHVKRLVFKSVPEDSTRLAMLKKREADLAYGMNGAIAEEAQSDANLKVIPTLIACPFWLDFTEQWDPKSPWHDQRVRLAANYALDRKAISEAETLGHSPASGSIIPESFEYALKFEPYPYDPKKARQLLAEAGYAKGFDGGEVFTGPPYGGLAEGAANYLNAVGIRVRVRQLERAAFVSGMRERKLRGILVRGSAAYGNAATRIDAFVVTEGGAGVYGGYPDIDELFKKQAGELDLKKRAALLHDIQRNMHERVMFAPIWELAFINVVGPRLAESGLGLISQYAYVAPYEDVRLKP